MNYYRFDRILNNKIFSESKADLLQKIAQYPERFVGVFRPTKPKAKIIQNLSHSFEIKMGDAVEEIVREYLAENGCENLERHIEIDGEAKELDLHFKKGNIFYVVEQKMRDDHDSTKKRGQLNDFKKKLEKVSSKHASAKTEGVIFFVDPSLKKNKKFYSENLNDNARVVYGREFFEFVFGSDAIWNEIEENFIAWQKKLPDFPEINFDKDAEASFHEIKEISPKDYIKIFSNEKVVREILPVLFPERKALCLLVDYYSGKDGKKFAEATKEIKRFLGR